MNYVLDIYHGLIPLQQIDYHRLIELLNQYSDPTSKEHQMIAHIIEMSFEQYLQQAQHLLSTFQQQHTTQPAMEFSLA